VSSGATVSSETITSGLDQTVFAGGTTVSISLASAGEQDISGGTTSATSIASGATQYVYSGVASASVVSNGGYQDDFATTTNTTVSSGGIEIVESGGTANSTTVLSGGEIVVYYGATVNGLNLSSGGTELMLSSGGIFPTGAAVRRGATAKKNAAVLGASTASASAETTVANLIQAMASFNAGSANDGALFESVSGGGFHEETGRLAASHASLIQHHG